LPKTSKKNARIVFFNLLKYIGKNTHSAAFFAAFFGLPVSLPISKGLVYPEESSYYPLGTRHAQHQRRRQGGFPLDMANCSARIYLQNLAARLP